VLNIGHPDEFVEQGKPEELYHLLKLDAEGIVAQVTEYLKSNDME
jgi:deoxyxylulose-5-phosphate synthase